MLHTYRDLIVWKKAIELTVKVYQFTDTLPREELYGMISQMRRSASSIPANIAEGRLRNSEKEFRQFLSIAYGSGGELETHLEVAKQVWKVDQKRFGEVCSLLDEVMRLLRAFLARF